MKGMSNNQIIQNEAAKLAPATLHTIATAHHTPEQIAAIAAKAITIDENGNEKPATIADVEAVLAADELHTIAKWNSLNKRIRTGEKSLITCYLWKYTTKPSKEQREAAEAEGKEAAPAPHYYPTKSYLFSCLQVEDSKPTPEARFKSTAEIMAITRSWPQSARPQRSTLTSSISSTRKSTAAFTTATTPTTKRQSRTPPRSSTTRARTTPFSMPWLIG